jgi:hypothetical protein
MRRSTPLFFVTTTLALLLGGSASPFAANIAPLGSGILGYKAEVDSGPGTLLFHVGSSSAIIDGNIDTRVDNWSAGADGGQGISFVGVV